MAPVVRVVPCGIKSQAKESYDVQSSRLSTSRRGICYPHQRIPACAERFRSPMTVLTKNHGPKISACGQTASSSSLKRLRSSGGRPQDVTDLLNRARRHSRSRPSTEPRAAHLACRRSHDACSWRLTDRSDSDRSGHRRTQRGGLAWPGRPSLNATNLSTTIPQPIVDAVLFAVRPCQELARVIPTARRPASSTPDRLPSWSSG